MKTYSKRQCAPSHKVINWRVAWMCYGKRIQSGVLRLAWALVYICLSKTDIMMLALLISQDGWDYQVGSCSLKCLVNLMCHKMTSEREHSTTRIESRPPLPLLVREFTHCICAHTVYSLDFILSLNKLIFTSKMLHTLLNLPTNSSVISTFWIVAVSLLNFSPLKFHQSLWPLPKGNKSQEC